MDAGQARKGYFNLHSDDGAFRSQAQIILGSMDFPSNSLHLLQTEEVDFNHPIFVRYASLSSVRQGGYDVHAERFHRPPARRGIYAFVTGSVEPFLIGKTTLDARR
jgi:hypothetical protein